MSSYINENMIIWEAVLVKECLGIGAHVTLPVKDVCYSGVCEMVSLKYNAFGHL